MRLPIVLFAVIVLTTIAACGGPASPYNTGHGGPPPTRSATPVSETPLGQQIAATTTTCKSGDFTSYLATVHTYGGEDYLTFLFNSWPGCVLTGPPEVHAYAANGEELGADYERSGDCASTSGDFSRCVDTDAMGLDDGRFQQSTAYGHQPSAIVILGRSGETCHGPGGTARSIEFTFSDSASVRVDLQQGIPMACNRRVTLAGYGPSVDATVYSANCTIDQLAALWLFSGASLGNEYYEFGVSNKSAEECRLTGPPVLRLLDEAGNDLGISYTANDACDAYGELCVIDGPIQMLPDATGPVSGWRNSGQITLTVWMHSIGGIDPPCATSSEAHTVEASFAGTSGGLRLDFPHDVGVQNCQPQVVLRRFS